MVYCGVQPFDGHRDLPSVSIWSLFVAVARAHCSRSAYSNDPFMLHLFFFSLSDSPSIKSLCFSYPDNGFTTCYMQYSCPTVHTAVPYVHHMLFILSMPYSCFHHMFTLCPTCIFLIFTMYSVSSSAGTCNLSLVLKNLLLVSFDHLT